MVKKIRIFLSNLCIFQKKNNFIIYKLKFFIYSQKNSYNFPLLSQRLFVKAANVISPLDGPVRNRRAGSGPVCALPNARH
jgi:hypothetical protein